MAVSDAQKKAITKYDAKTYDKFLVRVKKGEKAAFEAAACAVGESLNGYVVSATKDRIARQSAVGAATVVNDRKGDINHASV